MKKHFCDRCEKEIPDCTMRWIRVRETYKRVIFFVPAGMERNLELPKEICQECMNEFYHWWAQGKEKSNSQRNEIDKHGRK